MVELRSLTLRQVLRAAEAAWDAKQYGAVRGLTDVLLAASPGNLAAAALRGEAQLALGRADSARADFEAVLAVDPENLGARIKLGQALAASGRLSAALRVLHEAAELDPTDREVREALALVLARGSDRWPQLPESTPLWQARQALRRDSPASALELTAAYLASKPGNLIALLLRVEAFWRAGDDPALRRLSRQLLARRPTLLKPRLLLALAAPVVSDSDRADALADLLVEDPSETILSRLVNRAEPRSTSADDLRIDVPASLLRDWAADEPDVPSDGRLKLPPPNPTRPDAPIANDALADVISGELTDQCDPPIEIPSRVADDSAIGDAVVEVLHDGDAGAKVHEAGDASVDDAADEPANGDARPGADVLVLCSSRERLVARYGLDEFRRLVRRLSTAAGELTALGVRLETVFVDDRRSVWPRGLEPVAEVSPKAVKGLLNAALLCLVPPAELTNERQVGLLLLGGDDIVPAYRLPNPVDDDEEAILSDVPYGDPPPSWPTGARVPVGRLPDDASGNLALLLRQIDTLVEARRLPRAGVAGPLVTRAARQALEQVGLAPTSWTVTAVGAASWGAVMERAVRDVFPGADLKVCPPASAERFEARWLEGRRFLHFGLRGDPGCPEWLGDGESSGAADEAGAQPALGPEQLSGAMLGHPIVFTTASYAALVAGKSSATSLTLRFLAEGAVGVIGPTGVAYGCNQPPLAGADLLASLFWRRLREGVSVGVALDRARADYARQESDRQGFLDGGDRKTIAQFTLLGDPLLRVCVQHGARGAPDGPALLTETLTIPEDDAPEARPANPRLIATAVQRLRDDFAIGHSDAIRLRQRQVTRASGEPNEGSVQRETEPATITEVTARTPLAVDDWRRLTRVTRVSLDADGRVIKVLVSK